MLLRAFLCLILMSCASPKKIKTANSLNITVKTPNELNLLMSKKLRKLAKIYDLSSFLYTKTIVIDSTAEDRSHPVLTLNTRYVNEPDKMLSQLLHEELHWWMESNLAKVQVAIPDLKRTFRNSPEIRGAKDPDATYRHLIICWMEYMAMVKYRGEETAKGNLRHFIYGEKRYPWIYEQVLLNHKKIEEIVGKHHFIPEEIYPRSTLLR